MTSTDPQHVRLDKWLWAARFFKTRSLAAQAIAAGHIRLNGSRAKAAKALAPGDMLEIIRGTTTWTVRVRELSARRRGAAEAQMLYEETEESRERRERLAAEIRANPLARLDSPGRPSKRDRRRLDRLRGK